MGQILLAGEEPQERPTLLRDLVADRPAQHGIAGFERVEDRSQRDRAVELKFYFAADVRQRSQMLRDYDSDHGSAVNVYSPRAIFAGAGFRMRGDSTRSLPCAASQCNVLAIRHSIESTELAVPTLGESTRSSHLLFPCNRLLRPLPVHSDKESMSLRCAWEPTAQLARYYRWVVSHFQPVLDSVAPTSPEL